MAERWVIDGSAGWLNARATTIDWSAEIEELGYVGPIVPGGRDRRTTQVRWMLNPRIGLPTAPFTVWLNRDPGGNLTKQQLANLPEWQRIEIVGLPVDSQWEGTGYGLDSQGPVDGPLDPVDAAWRRLDVGAPVIGWTGLALGDLALPEWRAPNLDAFLRRLVDGPVLASVRNMLTDLRDPLEHYDYVDRRTAGRPVDGAPRLILDETVGLTRAGEQSSSEWHPLRMLALGAGSDPYAALALGFGTAIDDLRGRDDTILMVSVVHRLRRDGPDFELADVVRPFAPLAPPGRPSGLSTALVNHTRPQHVDGPGLDSIGVGWNRPLNPAYAPASLDAPYPTGYVIGRFGPELWRSEVLNTPRPNDVEGWLAYVPSHRADDRPMSFTDHLLRAGTIGHPPVPIPDVLSSKLTYAVAAQDLFGRWSPWQTVPFEILNEPAQVPHVVSVALADDGSLRVDFSWDWSDRSPEFVELSGAWTDASATAVIGARLDFAGDPAPAASTPAFAPLDQNLSPAADWGAAQDADAAEPGVRYYRFTDVVPIDFAGFASRQFQVQARGQCHVHRVVMFPFFNISPFSPPAVTTVLDPRPPGPPVVPEAPQWASLPDPAGVSRAVLSWGRVERARGYAVYEATETALLSVLQLAGPDTSEAFTVRLARLRHADLAHPRIRAVFRRVQADLVVSAGGTVSFEVTLPRGSRVMHLFAVTAVSANEVESRWPADSKGFIAVAAPRLDAPAPPSLEAEATADPTTVNIRVELGHALPGGRVEIFRTNREALATSVDTMGLAVATVGSETAVVEVADAGLTPGWQPVRYRAVAWSARDDQVGLVEARSQPSTAVAVLIAPSTAPTVDDIRVNEAGSDTSEVLVSWATSAPFRVTPLGPHVAVLEAHYPGGDRLRLDGRLDALTTVATAALLPGPNPAERAIIHLEDGDDNRLYAWLPRPASEDASFDIEMKVIDPFGRIGRATAVVPPLPVAPPTVDTIDPDSGRPGNTFTIFGSNLVLHRGDPVIVLFSGPTDPGAPPTLGPLTIVGETTPSEIVVVVPEFNQEADFDVVLSRSDGAEIGAGTFSIILL